MKTLRGQTRYEVNEIEQQALFDYLQGNKNLRQLGETFKKSHTQSIGIALQVVRQWFQEGKIKVTKT